VLVQGVPGRVVQPSPRQGRSQRIALGRVVVDHIEDHFDPVAVQGVHHGAELRADRGVVGAQFVHRHRGIARVRHEEGQRVVAPVVGHAALDEMVLVHVQLHGQQAQRGQPEALVVRQHRRAGQARVSAPQRSRHARMQRGQRLHMGLIEDRSGQWRVGPGHDGRAAAQFFLDIDHAAARHALGVVVGASLVRRTGAIADLVRQPFQGPGQGARPGIDQQALRIETMPGVGLPRSVGAQAVSLSGAKARHKSVPDALRAARQADAVGFMAAGLIVETQLHCGGMARCNRDIDARTATEQRRNDTHGPRPAGLAHRGRGPVAAQGHVGASAASQITLRGGR
jgi:hypothetical protein